jgi:predicted anti-sigma-YlaC factor YlaD
MISCNDYQNRIVSFLDNESSEQDEKLLFAHLAECSECRAFHAEVISTRQLFSIATTIKPTVMIGRQFMRTVESEAQQGQNRRDLTRASSQTRFKADRRSHLLVYSSLAAAILLVVSLIACYTMSREIVKLRSQLQEAQQDLAVARAQGQTEENRDREQKAITALYLRMADLERRVERGSQSITTLLSAERYGTSDRQGDLRK